MSSSIKLGLLTIVSSAVAIPHYGGHSRFHKASAGYGSGASHAYPTGGWHSPGNGTAHYPAGTSVSPLNDKTTTVPLTVYQTATLVQTVYATHSKSAGGNGGYNAGYGAASSIGPEDVSTGTAACGAETIYVTATNKVTVTVTPSSPSSSASPVVPAYTPSAASSPYSPPAYSVYTPSTASSAYSPPAALSSKAAPASPSSSATQPSAPAGGYPVYSVSPSLPSSSVAEEKISVTLPHKPVETPAYTPPAVSNAAPKSSVAPVASSATPKASSTPSYAGAKRGLAYNDATLCSAFDASKFGFAYNWGTDAGGSLPSGIPFVPMMHKPSDSDSTTWLGKVDTAVKGGSKMVMGFNEPDHSAQANLSPEQACADWKTYMEPIASSHPEVTILGPSVTNGGAPMGLTWLDNFNKACPGVTWHGANIHFYDVYDDGTLDRFKAQVEKAASMFNKPVYVTEFGLNPGSASSDQAAAFLKGCIEYMDSSDSVKGYSWFMVGDGENQLNNGNGLSAIGQVYNS